MSKGTSKSATFRYYPPDTKGMSVTGPFSWCLDGSHDKCRQKYRRFVNERNKIVWLDEIAYCDCPVKSCECYKMEKVPFTKSLVDVELPDA